MSKQSLDQLIASLKSEAIEAAEKEAKEVLESARAKRQQMIREAEEKSRQILAKADKEAQNIQDKGQSALQQAARDLTISLQNDLLNLLGGVLRKEVQKEFKPDLMKTAILKVIENVGGEVELTMPEPFVKDLANYIHQQLKDTDTNVSISPEQHRLQYLSVRKTGQGWSYEISPEEVSILLQAHLTDNWVKLLQKEAK